MNFEQLGLIDPLVKALQVLNYKAPTPIQEKAIPLILKRKDVLGCARTGTGKTAAFTLPMIQLIHQIEGRKSNETTLRALIITPTRELAIQINDSIKAYSQNTNISHTAIFGGVKKFKQIARLKKGVHVLVATPGRLLDLIGEGVVDIETVKFFVLDEADKMLDMGFINDIKRVIKLLPAQRQSLFFSATMPNNIAALSNQILRDPVKVEINQVSSAAETVAQFVYYTNAKNKLDLLLLNLKDPKLKQVLVFTRTKHRADRVARSLNKKKIKAMAIHGNKSQSQRQKVLKDFKAGKIRVLVATDIAARGIDIRKLNYVINYDIPNVAEDYVHRIGRSGRAGEEGIAISYCEPEENSFIVAIQKLIKQKLQKVEDHPFPQTDKPMTPQEKREFNKEKQRRKQEFFANRKRNSNRRAKV